MKWLYIISSLLLYVNSEEQNKFAIKRSLPFLINGHAGFPSQLQVPLLLKPEDNWLQYKNDISPSYFLSPFYGLSPIHRPVVFGENLYNPGYTLHTGFGYPLKLGITAPVSVPQVVTPKPAQTINSLPCGATPILSSPPQQPLQISSPIPAPLPPPSQIGRLGSGSLGYVHLGNGLFALGSGSLGYTPPARTPSQSGFQLNYANGQNFNPSWIK